MPPSYYKYRAIDDDTAEGLAKNYSIQALFKSHARLASRKAFNDLFDSKIEITDPSPSEIYTLLNDPRSAHKAHIIQQWIGDTGISVNGRTFFKEYLKKFNQYIDDRLIYCVSGNNNHNLMWSHYASNHKGFCIEFQFPDPDEQPSPISYEEHIPSIPLIFFLQSHFARINNQIEIITLNALHTKLDDWEYEDEYRWIASDKIKPDLLEIDRCTFFPYEPSWVKSIIFGRRMSSRAKQFIIDNLPFRTEFKQAIEAKESIEIVPYDAEKHLRYGD
jgi:hypothetical protein